jgi:glutamyl-tRNA reductase
MSDMRGEPRGVLFVAGMSHRTAPIELREQLALEEEKIREILGDLANHGVLQEVMILSTCNRVEVYGVAAVPGEARAQAFGRLGSHRGLAWRELEPLLYTATGEEAALHAFRVAASLDSMVLGEPQILGQVKDAFALAQATGTAGPVLHALMSQAFGAAKRVRTETEVGRLAVSVSYAAVELARRIFDGLAGRAVLLVGAGEMG